MSDSHYKISAEDRAIWQAAKEAQDIRTGKIRKPGPRREPKLESSPTIDLRLRSRYVKQGRILYYNDLRTGTICYGKVLKVVGRSFVFKFDDRVVKLPLGVVDDRLFYTEEEARRFGRTKR